MFCNSHLIKLIHLKNSIDMIENGKRYMSSKRCPITCCSTHHNWPNVCLFSSTLNLSNWTGNRFSSINLLAHGSISKLVHCYYSFIYFNYLSSIFGTCENSWASDFSQWSLFFFICVWQKCRAISAAKQSEFPTDLLQFYV